MRQIGVLQAVAANDPEGPIRMAGFLQVLQQLGWTEGRNLRIDIRWASGDANLYRKYAAELVALTPDVILLRRVRPWRRCKRPPEPCQLYSRTLSIRSAPAGRRVAPEKPADR
jgi:hypothetical protein